MSDRRAVSILVAVGAFVLAACTGGNDAAVVNTTATERTGTSASEATLTPASVESPRGDQCDAAEAECVARTKAAQHTRNFLAREYPLNNPDLATVELHEILPVLPKDAIRSVDAPNFDSVAVADEWLDDREPVISLELGAEARAYPLQILMWHEIVNDVVDGEAVVVTYCPLCNSAIAFRRTVAGEVRQFGVSGALRRSDLIMYDRETETLWQQITGEAIVGEAAGSQLDFLSSQIVSWADFRDAFPNGRVLNRDTGLLASYGENPYPLYDRIGARTLFPIEEFDDLRLDAKERVLAVDLGDDPVAFPFSTLSELIVMTGESSGQAVVAFWQPGTLSPLDEMFIIAGRNIGAAGAFRPLLSGEAITFQVRDGMIMDLGTGSEWNVLGLATAGPLEGAQLTSVVSANHFWFAWSVFKPDTRVIFE